MSESGVGMVIAVIQWGAIAGMVFSIPFAVMFLGRRLLGLPISQRERQLLKLWEIGVALAFGEMLFFFAVLVWPG